MNNADDQLVAEYLSRLVACAASLPADRRDELVEEISAHIAEARQRPAPSADPAASGVQAILARLGKPEDIVRSAAEQAGFPAGESGAAGSAPPEGDDSSSPEWADDDRGVAAPSSRRLGAMEICAVILLLAGGFLAGIGWIVGVVLLWSSDRWRTSDKVLGTLIWPGGLATTLAVVFFGLAIPAGVSICSSGSGSCSTSPPVWVSLVVILLVVIGGIGGPILVAIRLIRRAQTVPGEQASAHGTLSSSY